MKNYTVLLLVATILFYSCSSDDNNGPGDPPESDLSLVNVFPNLNFDRPVDLQNAGDGSNRIFVVERDGIIKVFDNEPTAQAINFLDIESQVHSAGEQGLLGLAFHPNFQSNGFFYVNYNPTPNTTRISRFSISASTPNLGDPTSELILLSFFQPATNHNGGQLTFGPDGYLYISSGDGGPQSNGQDLTTLTGSILRIDVDNPEGGLNYSIPESNPFINDSNARDEIYAYGLRNPWRMSFDSVSGNLWVADVGAGQREEVDIIVNGGNYGWNIFEGTACNAGPCDTEGLIDPFYEYDRQGTSASITGGYVYRGTLNTELSGRYVYGDFVTGEIWSLNINSAVNALHFDTEYGISAFGVDEQNELYVLDFFAGDVYKFIED